MDAPPQKLRLTAWLKPIAMGHGALVSAGGALVLLGWWLRVDVLKEIVPGMVPMNPVAAVGFVLTGASLLCFRSGAGQGGIWRKLGIGLAVPMVALGALKLASYAFGWNLPFDLLLFRTELKGGGTGYFQMAPTTALNFLLSGLALWFLHASRRPNSRRVQFLALAVTFVSLVPLVGYLYSASKLYSIGNFPMALPTAALFFLLGTGMFMVQPEFGMAALFTNRSPGGTLARRLLPIGFFAPIILGALWRWGQARGFFNPGLGMSLMVVISVAIFTALIWRNAILLDRSDHRRTEAEHNLQKAHDELEQRVRERTAELSATNQELASQVAERQRAEDKVRSQLARLELLQRITRAIGERLDLPSIFQVVVRTLEDQMPLDFCCIGLRDATSDVLKVASAGLHGIELASVLAMSKDDRLDITENGLTPCVSGRLVYEPDLERSSAAFSQRLARAGLHSLVASPLAVESNIFGVLFACRREANSFSSAECEFLRHLSEHIALAVQQGQLHAALQQAYDDLQQSQQAIMQQERLRALGQMASGIAHDINNAISPVTLYTESLLEQEKNLSPRARDYLETIQRSIEDVRHTVSRMREFYRKREQELTLETVALNPVMEQVVDLSRARWSDMPQSQGLFIETATDLAADLPAIRGVESEIREALLNLVFNAVDAMPQGGKLTVRTRTVNPQGVPDGGAATRAVVEVIDTGAGMDEETRRRCLEPFFTTKGERGTGLGLAMVYGIAQRHGADIQIESAPGQGTTVRLIFPPAGTSAPASAPVATHAAPRSRMRILVIDDDPMLLKSLRHILESDGHVVVTAHGGQEGIDAFLQAQAEHKEVSAVITDLGMPYVDGRKVAATIKSASPSTPVIMLTGWGQRLAAEGDVPADVDHLLSKPLKIRDIRQALARCERL